MNETINIYEEKKYTIMYILNTRLSASAKAEALENLPRALGISRRQFARYMYAKKNEPPELRSSYLDKIAKYLDVEIQDLLT